MTSLAGLLLPELEQNLTPLPRFRASQIYRWILNGALEFDQMTDIPRSLQSELSKKFSLYSSVLEKCYTDKDAKKIVLTLKDGLKTEAVLLRDGKSRLTACLSTQAGCPAGCIFCKTGSLGFSRNLDYTEITEQFLHLKNIAAGEKKSPSHIIDNIVIMGMGEPLLNLAQLRKAIDFFTDKNGLNYSKRRITISTCGVYEGLLDMANNGPFTRLAFSLVTGDEELRKKLMPIAKKNPLDKVKESLILFQQKSGSRITLEIPLLGGINTREEDAISVSAFSKNLDAVINIIPWNPCEGLEFEGKPLLEPEKKEIKNYITLLEKQGLKVTTRLHKGRGAAGACGQLGAVK